MTKPAPRPPTDPSSPRGLGFGELRAGPLGVRLAEAPWELEAAQALRYR
ncbi:MAG: hemolysin-like protein, partial [Elioraea sp.]|nr:hemolysin-like protein [Elioraea sp.]